MTREALLTASVLAAMASSAEGQRLFDEMQRGLPADLEAVATGDVDGDGDLDIAFGAIGQNRLYLNGGVATFVDATAQLPAQGKYTGGIALADVDGDGDLDLVLANDVATSGAQNRLFVNDGHGTFSDATSRLPADTDRTYAVALGDVDEDGDLDVVFGDSDKDTNRLYLNDGTGTFTDAAAAGMPLDFDYTTGVALGDVDGDQDLDAVFANGNDPARLLRNLARHLDAPALLRSGLPTRSRRTPAAVLAPA